MTLSTLRNLVIIVNHIYFTHLYVFQIHSTPPVQQNSNTQAVPNTHQQQQLAAAVAAANLTHHRNSSYSRAMSLPVAGSNLDSTVNSSAPNNQQDSFRFNANFDKSGAAMEANSNLAGSPILESTSPFQRSGKKILTKDFLFNIFGITKRIIKV